MSLWGWPWRTSTGASGFGRSSTAEEVTEGIDAHDFTAIVTGATNGIGKETARVLALRGAEVIIPSRTIESGLRVKESLLEQNPSAKLHVMEMDLSSLDSVETFARSFISTNKRLNILIDNAGIMACPFQLSRDGIEMQFATNHLGHFLLTKLLLEKMKSTAKETGVQGRIINVSSSAHRRGYELPFSLDKLNDKSSYKRFTAYGQSKLANILHANELSRKLQEEGSNVTANSLHPGLIQTNITRFLGFSAALGICLKPFLKTIPQGAATTCYLAINPKVKDATGKYYVNCNEENPLPEAKDNDLANKLWVFSEELLRKGGK
ncbi:short-chain dehydrogenase TIC 32, chloroplastic isoform X1 [Dendrobium catenatum]|uniref:short-chain dehydrogenase TIC 32, chloroplastic isoform X1 n=1 Tax=Dendrobium catenatum TaxID=906689 RepID=UPI0009F1CDC8|nr:short-chain dehydrogenase TIC 32, chloroplastic isoform X1 [Dendrobium catenatum]